MIDRKEYLESLVDTDLEKLIISNLDKDPEELLDICLDYFKKEVKQ